MNKALGLVFLMVCINLSSGIVCEVWQIGPLNQVQAEEMPEIFNSTEIEESWRWPGQSGLVGDVRAGLTFLGKLRYLIQGFPIMLSSLNVDPAIIAPLNALWSLFIFLSVVGFIAGRKTTDD